jgi:hypothetical protein
VRLEASSLAISLADVPVGVRAPLLAIVIVMRGDAGGERALASSSELGVNEEIDC